MPPSAGAHTRASLPAPGSTLHAYLLINAPQAGVKHAHALLLRAAVVSGRREGGMTGMETSDALARARRFLTKSNALVAAMLYPALICILVELRNAYLREARQVVRCLAQRLHEVQRGAIRSLPLLLALRAARRLQRRAAGAVAEACVVL